MVNAPDIAPRGTLADPLLPEPWRIAAVRKETADTFTLSLEPVNGAGGRAFAAGQFNMLYVFGVGEVPISICGNPLEPAPLQHTTRAVGNVTRAMWKLKAGDVIGVRGPFGSSWPVGQAAGRDVVIVADVYAAGELDRLAAKFLDFDWKSVAALLEDHLALVVHHVVVDAEHVACHVVDRVLEALESLLHVGDAEKQETETGQYVTGALQGFRFLE
jgi:hypothetical protein